MFDVRSWPAAERWFSSGSIWPLLVLLLTTGCASLPPRDTVAAPASFAIARPAQARLAATADRALAREAHDSAFRLLPIGSAAYQTLIELTSQAEHSLDFQTFVLQGDTSGALLLKALREAAARGVRVRALIDDLHTESAERLLSDMSACEAIEVRLINPFVRLRGSRAAKLVSSLDQVSRVNHRMHNKLFIADNVLAVIGGRNVGDPYFMRAEEGENFIDLDVLAAGAAVEQMSKTFDNYWNSEFAWPIDRIVAPAGGRLERCARFDQAVSHVRTPPPDLGVPLHLARYATVADELRRGALELVGAEAEVVADPVDKLAGTRVGSRQGTVRAFIGGQGLGSNSEVLAFSPYYVPGNIGIESIRQNRRNGVRLRVLTNSLASSDEPVVHAGYLEYRREMVEIGVELYELSPKFAKLEQRLGRFGTSSPALHMKAIVFDQRSVFIGSMNLDGRSEQYNTEVGVMIRSQNLTRELMALVNFESSSYRVELNPDGQLRWVNFRRGVQTVHDTEPEVGFWRNVSSKLLGLLIPRDWL
jgi:putative cardiolipin synthase